VSPSWGYHGDDGKKFSGSTGADYGQTFGTGDTIGCRVRRMGDIIFTKNGVSLGVAFGGISGKLYPAVGMSSRDARIRANFGQTPFKYCTTET